MYREKKYIWNITVHLLLIVLRIFNPLWQFANSIERFSLTISLKRTEVLFQSREGSNFIASPITIENYPLTYVEIFTYIGSNLSRNITIDHDVEFLRQVLLLASLQRSYGREFIAVILLTLLYGCEVWTPYWWYISWIAFTFEILSHTEMHGIEFYVE